VSARAVAPEVPARRAGSCTPRPAVESCYLRITAATPLTYAVASGPAHGAAAFDGAQLTYTPAAGFAGRDALTYVATDGRGLRSPPATVSVEVAPAPGAVPGPAVGTGARRLLALGRVRRVTPRRLAVRLLCRPVAAGACAGLVEARIAGRRAGRTRFAGLAAGRRRTVVLRLRRSAARRRVVLRATVRDAAGAGRAARRVVRPRRAVRPRRVNGSA
jgi:hypothetical protein